MLTFSTTLIKYVLLRQFWSIFVYRYARKNILYALMTMLACRILPILTWDASADCLPFRGDWKRLWNILFYTSTCGVCNIQWFFNNRIPCRFLWLSCLVSLWRQCSCPQSILALWHWTSKCELPAALISCGSYYVTKVIQTLHWQHGRILQYNTLGSGEAQRCERLCLPSLNGELPTLVFIPDSVSFTHTIEHDKVERHNACLQAIRLRYQTAQLRILES